MVGILWHYLLVSSSKVKDICTRVSLRSVQLVLLFNWRSLKFQLNLVTFGQRNHGDLQHTERLAKDDGLESYTNNAPDILQYVYHNNKILFLDRQWKKPSFFSCDDMTAII